VRVERLGQLKNPPIGTRSRDLPACSIMPQPTTLPHTQLTDMVTLIDFGEQYVYKILTFCSFVLAAITSSVLGPYIFLLILHTLTHNPSCWP
jgi:hypothetical protein